MELKQDVGNRGGGRQGEGLPQQALGEAVMARMEGGEDVQFRGGQSGNAALAAQQAGEEAGEIAHRPGISLPRRMEVDALVTPLFLFRGVLGSQGIEIMGRDGPGRRRGRRLGMASFLRS